MKKGLKNYYPQILIVLLVIIFVVLSGLLFRQYEYLRRVDEVSSYKEIIDNLRHKKPLTEKDIDVVNTWMTFGYINTVFNLPPNYFKDSLSISNSNYPNISIGKYARIQNIDSLTYKDTIKKSLMNYFIKNKELHN